MPGPKTLTAQYDHSVEQKALRDAGILGRGGGGMGHVLYAIDYAHLVMLARQREDAPRASSIAPDVPPWYER